MISKENEYFYSALNNLNNKNYDDAISDLLKLIEISPENLDAYYNLAKAYVEMKDYDNAIKTYNKSIYYSRAEIYFYMGLFDEAILDLEKVIKMNPAYPDTYYLMSVIYRKKKQLKKSLYYLKETLNYNNEDYIAYYDIYKLYNKLSEVEKDDEKREKYSSKAYKALEKSANLGYEKAIEKLKDL